MGFLRVNTGGERLGHAVSASLPVVARYIMPGLVRKLLHGPELPKVACPGLQVAEEAPDDAAVIVIAVPCPRNEALSVDETLESRHSSTKTAAVVARILSVRHASAQFCCSG